MSSPASSPNDRRSSDGPASLTLTPLADGDRAAVCRLLDKPRLNRRVVFSGINQVHRIDWAPARRTFVVRHDGQIAGTVELRQEDDEPETWELSVALDEVSNAQLLDGARCAAAGLFFAFEVMGAESVWFWVTRDRAPVYRVAHKMGFVKLHPLLVPGGKPADVFELDRRGWQLKTVPALERYLQSPVDISDGERTWRGEAGGFFALG